MGFEMTVNQQGQTRWEHVNGKAFLYLTHGELCFHCPICHNLTGFDGLVRH
jgi:hypothetical protein